MSETILKISKLPDFQAMGGVECEQICKAEQRLGLQFSAEYRAYLAAYGVASANGHELTGICAHLHLNVVDVTITERINSPAVPKNWYVLEQANIDGIVIWQSGTGEVYQTAPNTLPVRLCGSLCKYLELPQD